VDHGGLLWPAVAVSHDTLTTSAKLDELRQATASDLIDRIRETYSNGLPFDEDVVFELANRVLVAEKGPSDGHYEGDEWVETF
jgi:hypothetical protein